MNLRPALGLLLAPVLALCIGAQEAPRLDGSNVEQAPEAMAPAIPTPGPAPAANAPVWKGTPQTNAPAPILPIQPSASTAPKAPATSFSSTPATRSRSSRKSKPSPQVAAVAPIMMTPPPPPTPGDLPPTPATIQFYGGLLTVHATNASLAQILRDTAVQTGMQIEGTPEDQRVFGNFGPASVTVVLGQLLDGGPSNYVLFGRNSNESPRTLVISPKSSLAPGQVAGVAPRPAMTVNNEDTDDEDDAAPAAPQPPRPFRGNPVNTPNPDGTPKSPQQIIDEMQKRRQEQQIQPLAQPTPPDANTQ